MKIIQISPYFPPHVGGVEYHVKELADGLSRGTIRLASLRLAENGHES